MATRLWADYGLWNAEYVQKTYLSLGYFKLRCFYHSIGQAINLMKSKNPVPSFSINSLKKDLDRRLNIWPIYLRSWPLPVVRETPLQASSRSTRKNPLYTNASIRNMHYSPFFFGQFVWSLVLCPSLISEKKKTWATRHVFFITADHCDRDQSSPRF